MFVHVGKIMDYMPEEKAEKLSVVIRRYIMVFTESHKGKSFFYTYFFQRIFSSLLIDNGT